MGSENNEKRAWVENIMKDKKKNVSVALTVTSSNITAAIYLAAISLTLCSLIGAWITNSTYTLLDSTIIYGDTSESTMALKYISLLTCFLLAFSCFVQSARHLVNASYLISNPSNDVSASSVVLPVLRGALALSKRPMQLNVKESVLPHPPLLSSLKILVKVSEDKEKNVSTALTVIGSNINASIYLATISLTLCSIIGVWIANSASVVFESSIIYGDRRQSTMAIKFITLLTCFLLAFSCFVQSARHLVHASYLISNPSKDVSASSVELSVIRGGELWSLGLRALYFALNLLLWFFGPIPMFICSVCIVILLHYLDSNSTPFNEYGSGTQTAKRNARRDV
nr:hypothetical protein CFP56_69788 [Quercus suber]